MPGSVPAGQDANMSRAQWSSGGRRVTCRVCSSCGAGGELHRAEGLGQRLRDRMALLCSARTLNVVKTEGQMDMALVSVLGKQCL